MKYILLAGLFLLCGCTNPIDTKRILTENGYKNIELFGYGWFSCSKDDAYATKFKALSPSGSTIYGTVCEGFIFKNATIRFS